MSAGLFPWTRGIFRPGKVGFFPAATAVLIAASVLVLGGCVRKERNKSTPTSGSLVVYATADVEPVIQKGADAFNKLYTQANVAVYPLESRTIVDSMIQGRTDAGYFDRQLSAAESLTVVASRKHVYSFLLGTTVATWLVNPANTVATIDSTQLLKILSGDITSWKDLGGADGPIHIYLPPIGDGAWLAIQDFLRGSLVHVEAHYWPNDSTVLANVKSDPAALGLVGMQITPIPELKKLKWVDPLLAEPVPANIGSLQEGKYPFRVGLYYYTIADRTDLASGFLSFLAGNVGQRLIADNGFLPAMIPVRIVNLSPTGDQK